MAPTLYVSIVVCTYNRAESLRATLASLDAQQTPSDLTWELVVVDNNSTDATAAVIEEFAGTARTIVRSLFAGEQGLSRARNAGVAGSRGDIVAFTDDDVHPAPHWISRIVANMQAGADIVGGPILPLWSRPPPAWLSDPSFHGILTIMQHPEFAEVVDAHRQPCVWGANMAVRRSVFDRVGVFDPRRGLQGSRRYGGEDTEFVRRALAAGYRAVYDPSVVVWHRIGADRMSVRYLSRVCFHRAEAEARLRPYVARGSFLGIPLGLYRSLAKQLARWIAAVALRRPGRIQRWLDCCRCVGTMHGVRRRHLDSPAPRGIRATH